MSLNVYGADHNEALYKAYFKELDTMRDNAVLPLNRAPSVLDTEKFQNALKSDLQPEQNMANAPLSEEEFNERFNKGNEVMCSIFTQTAIDKMIFSMRETWQEAANEDNRRA